MGKTKTGIIDVGGGLRGIYAAGIFDYLMDNSIAFDYGIGVSAGSANLTAYMGGQKKRNYAFYHDYSSRKEYMGVGGLIKNGNFLNLDYVYGTLSNSGGESPLDYERIARSAMEWYVVATNAESGRPRYFTRADIAQDDYDILKASSALPGACRPQYIGGTPYYDGALGDPVPIAKAFADGCDKVVLVLTKPEHVLRRPARDRKIARLIRKEFPRAALQLELRAAHYNEGVRLAQTYAREGRALIISPSDTCGMKTLTRDEEALDKMYAMGYEDAKAIANFL